jgi:hypothetical protein
MPANAFRTIWLTHCADCFGKENYASIWVTMETGFIVGRKLNLGPTCFFDSTVELSLRLHSLGHLQGREDWFETFKCGKSNLIREV